MTRLLVSVRSAAEAVAAEAGGADLIDIKEPLRGSLGSVDPRVMREVVDILGGRRPISIALGELNGAALDYQIPAGVSYAKFGLAGYARDPAWPGHWARALELLPSGTRPVAVIYADWRHAAAPAPRTVLDSAHALGCAAMLIDTFDKSRGDLFRHFSSAELAQWLAAARQRKLLTVLGGSLSMSTLPRAIELAPDYVAVRGAACREGRTGPLDRRLVHALAILVRQASQTSTAAHRPFA